MKKRFIVAIAAFLLVFPASVFAETVAPPTATTDTLQQRIDKRKAELKLSLTAAEKQKLTAKCKASQVILAKLQSRISTIQTNRTQQYGDMQTRVSALVTKLKSQDVDTAQLDEAVTRLNALVVQFTTDLQTYKQTIDDDIAMECTKDVVGFKSILESARTGRTTVLKDASDVAAQLRLISGSLAAFKDAKSTGTK